jgi:hypothetical protein
VEVEEPSAIVERLITGQAVPILARDATLPPGLAQLVDRSISGDPDQRPPNAREVRLALAPHAGVLSHAGHVAALVDAASAMSMRGSRYSIEPAQPQPAPAGGTVVKTVPPDVDGPPGPVFAAPAPVRAPTEAFAPTQPARRRGSGLKVFAVVVFATLVGAGAWLHANPSVLRNDQRPPMPTAAPPAAPRPAPTPVDLDIDSLDDDSAARKPPSRAAPAPRPGGATPAPGGTTLPFPTAIPSQLPPLPSLLPPGITLPPGFPWPPANTAPAAQPPPAPSSSTSP